MRGHCTGHHGQRGREAWRANAVSGFTVLQAVQAFAFVFVRPGIATSARAARASRWRLSASDLGLEAGEAAAQRAANGTGVDAELLPQLSITGWK
jgi:hypothetical protein